MKRIFIIIVVFLGCSNLYGQYKDTAFIYTYGGIQNDVCNQIKPTYDGGYIMIGTSNSFGCGNTDFYAVKIDSVGRHEWSKTYGGLENEEGFSVTPTFDKGYAFIGFTDSYGAGGYDVYLVKTDSLGNFQWQRTYGGSDWDFGYSIQQLSDSGFVICGLTYSYGPGNGNVYIIRTNKNGDTLWTRAIGDSGYYSVGNSICVQKDSLYGIVGNKSGLGSEDTVVYFTLMDNKGIIKKDTTCKISTNSNIGNSIRETLDHGFIIFGSNDNYKLGKPDEMMIKLDSIGKLQWVQTYTSSGYSIGHDAVQASDGSYLALSTSNAYGLGGFAMRVWHMDSHGNPLCGPSFGGTDDEQGNSIAIAKNGNVMFAGTTNSIGYTVGLDDAYLVRLKNDSVFNIVNYYLFPYLQFKDTTSCTLGIEMQSVIIPAIKIYPNPTSNSATILIQGGTNGKYSFRVYNEIGACVIQNSPLQPISHGQFIGYLQKGSLTAGVYFCEIYNTDGIAITSSKIIVE